MTAITAEYKQELGSRLLTSTYRHDKVHDVVEGWNWNMGIFEIYDELRDGHTGEEQEQLLTFAYNYFNNDVMIKELASHFCITIETDEDSPIPC